MGKANLGTRIDEALAQHGGEMRFHHLAVTLWPDRKSHSYRTEGGPPGCYMTLSAGLRRYGFPITNGLDGKSYGGARIVRSRPTNPKPAGGNGG